MPKTTTVIDIGSNSIRMAVYSKSSRFGFRLIKEVKSRVRLAHGAYDNGSSIISQDAISKGFATLKDFVSISNSLGARKILCGATSALRDAPNKNEFVNLVKNNLNLNIKIINGEEEAYLGAIAALNLLACSCGITVDIGGGSTEFAIIKDNKIEDKISLNLGSFRIKELFDKKTNWIEDARAYIDKELEKLPAHFKTENIIGIGGSIRAFSKTLVKNNYPIPSVHGFTYKTNEQEAILEKIVKSSVLDLKKLGFKKDRFDTIREGMLIFTQIIKKLEARQITTSGVGVREGIFLKDLLRNQAHRFPPNFNPSVKNLTDRYLINEANENYNATLAINLFDELKPMHNLDERYKTPLRYATKLADIGVNLNFYSHNEHSQYVLLNSLSYGFTHEDRVLIALLVKYHNKKSFNINELDSYGHLAPSKMAVTWLSFILSTARCANKNYAKNKITFKFDRNTLHIEGTGNSPLCFDCIKKLKKPIPMAVLLS